MVNTDQLAKVDELTELVRRLNLDIESLEDDEAILVSKVEEFCISILTILIKNGIITELDIEKTPKDLIEDRYEDGNDIDDVMEDISLYLKKLDAKYRRTERKLLVAKTDNEILKYKIIRQDAFCLNKSRKVSKFKSRLVMMYIITSISITLSLTLILL